MFKHLHIKAVLGLRFFFFQELCQIVFSFNSRIIIKIIAIIIKPAVKQDLIQGKRF